MALLHNILQNISAAVILPLVSLGGFFTQANVLVIVPPQPAIVSVLPAELKPPPTPASTTAIAAVSAPKANSDSAGIAPSSTAPATATSAPADVSSRSVAATAKRFLSKTNLSLNQRYDGSYWIALNTGNENWTLSKTSVGGFDVSYSCDPQPDMSAQDGEPSFQIRKSYDCDISLAKKSGQKETRRFSFKTGPGRLVVSVASGMDAVIKDGKNESGFVFDNQDDFPVIVLGLSFDVSFSALATSTPMALRFTDPATEAPLADDFQLQNLPPDPSLPYVAGRAGAKAAFPIGFTVKEHSQKMILVQALGVSKAPSFLAKVNPEIKIILKRADTDRGDVKESLGSAAISWKCVVVDPGQFIGQIVAGQCLQ